MISVKSELCKREISVSFISYIDFHCLVEQVTQRKIIVRVIRERNEVTFFFSIKINLLLKIRNFLTSKPQLRVF